MLQPKAMTTVVHYDWFLYDHSENFTLNHVQLGNDFMSPEDS